MAGSKARHAPRWLTLATLPSPLSARARSSLARQLVALLRWQHDLARFPRVTTAPDAMPFVSLYVRGQLRGCFGSDEGPTGERLVRAFLRALYDVRFGGIRPGDRAVLAAQLSYPRRPRAIAAERVLDEIEPGTHGLGLLAAGGEAVILLPQVARDESLDGRGLLEAIAQKAGLAPDAWQYSELALFETDDVVAWPRGATPAHDASPLRLAARWLRGLVQPDGEVVFGVDGRSGALERHGVMHHGRVAVALRALQAWADSTGSHAERASLDRARRVLGQEVAEALAGARVPGWPDDRAMIGGTLALVAMAEPRADLVTALERFAAAAEAEIAAAPWYAAQVAAVLGARTPARLWRACVRDLEDRPWAPWTAIAARSLGDEPTRRRCERALVAALRPEPPFAGGAAVTTPPETALTALTMEALAGARSAAARRALTRARSFLLSRQWRSDTLVAAVDPGVALGGFALSPVSTALRCDVTGHAILALLG
jgi:AMMECR1 domain-containing protein